MALNSPATRPASTRTTIGQVATMGVSEVEQAFARRLATRLEPLIAELLPVERPGLLHIGCDDLTLVRSLAESVDRTKSICNLDHNGRCDWVGVGNAPLRRDQQTWSTVGRHEVADMVDLPFMRDQFSVALIVDQRSLHLARRTQSRRMTEALRVCSSVVVVERRLDRDGIGRRINVVTR